MKRRREKGGSYKRKWKKGEENDKRGSNSVK
jgi:hypothetical protein